MYLILKKIFIRLRMVFFSTANEKEVKRWQADGGDERFRYDYDLNSDSLVIDLGGYKGQWASDIYARYNCRIFVFEPVKRFAQCIMERFKKNSKIEVFCLALGADQRKEVCYLQEDGSSMFKRAAQKETIQFESICEFFKQKNIDQLDLMKMNIEGGEYEVLSNLLETGLINKIKNLQIQFHDVGPQSKAEMEKICNKLSATHWPRYQYEFVWESWERRK